MAEYYISYKELENLLDQYIAEVVDDARLIEHKAEILSALTGDYEQGNCDSAKEMVSLWENQINAPSQLLLGSRYIQVQQIMLDFLKVACTSGLIDALIVYISQGDFTGFTVSVGSGITVALWELFTTVKKLDDWDFCVYMQAVTHFRQYNEFTIEDLKSWFPDEEHPVCNMHNNTWDCDYLEEMTDTCKMMQKQELEKALKSLYDKELLTTKKEDHKYVFKFKK